MAEEHTVEPVELANPGFELRDTNLRGVLWFGVGLTVMLVIVFILMLLLYGFFNIRQVQGSAPPPPLLFEAELLPPEPRLQRLPDLDLEQMRAVEDTMLNSYGWVDKEAGVVRLPIERAMELTLDRGLPARPGSQE